MCRILLYAVAHDQPTCRRHTCIYIAYITGVIQTTYNIYIPHRHSYPIHNLTNTIITFSVVRQSSARTQSTSRSHQVYLIDILEFY